MKVVKKRKIKVVNLILLLSFLLVLVSMWFTVRHQNEDTFFFGYKPFLIATSSMEPDYPVYTFVIIKKDQYDFVKENDVIAFRSNELGGTFAYHRVIEITNDGFITKGDNNKTPDGSIVTKENYLGKEIFHTSITATVINKVKQPLGWFYYIVLPIVAILCLVYAIKLLKRKKN